MDPLCCLLVCRGAVLTASPLVTLVTGVVVRIRDELADSLIAADLPVDEIRDATDRPGRELVFIARRAA